MPGAPARTAPRATPWAASRAPPNCGLEGNLPDYGWTFADSLRKARWCDQPRAALNENTGL